MSGISAQRVDIAIPPGRALDAAGAVVLGIGLVLLWSSGLSWRASLGVTAAAIIYFLVILRARRKRVDWTRLVRDRTGAWWLQDGHGNRRAVEPLGSSVVSPWLVIFQGRLEPRGRVSLWLPASRVDPHQFRRLSTWLRLLD